MKAGVVTKRLSQIRTCLETRHDVKLEMGEMFCSTRICCFAFSETDRVFNLQPSGEPSTCREEGKLKLENDQ